MKKNILIVLLLLGSIILVSCSNSIRMPKHRKRAHCDCPTFSLNNHTRDTTPAMHNEDYTTISLNQ
ncbi:MAG: hypothetical protein IJR13_00490 [Bacteroidales bacterium]|nr:hypothetical protein [Bacteroidales bacterium]